MAGIFFAHSTSGGRGPRAPHVSLLQHPSAQVATGSIVGTVSDSTGSRSRRPGHDPRGHRNTTTTFVTDTSGDYTAPFLVPGTYEMQVQLQGFKKWIRRGIILQVNRPRALSTWRSRSAAIEEATTVVATRRSSARIPPRSARSSRRWRSRSCH